MNIQTKFLAFSFWLILGSNPLIRANNAPSIAVVPATTIGNEDTPPCNEPAPTNFHISEIFTDRIIVAWDPPAIPPFEYNIKAWETSTGNLVYDQNIPNNNVSWRILNLLPGTEYRIRNTPVCPDGTLSPYFGEDTGTALILDLVESGFAAPSGETPCTFNLQNQYCEANPDPGNVVRFRIRQTVSPFSSRFFGIYQVDGECTYTTVKSRPSDNFLPIKFYCDNGAGPGCQGAFLVIKKGTVEIAKLGLQALTNTTKNLYCISISGGYIVERFGGARGIYDNVPYSGCGPTGGRPSKSKDRSEEDWEEISPTQTLTANPNPFTDQLDIQLPFNNPTENTKISLYDLQGRLVMAAQSPGDQQTINLSTANLTPGMYFLRAESGGVIETVKVVKTQ